MLAGPEHLPSARSLTGQCDRRSGDALVGFGPPRLVFPTLPAGRPQMTFDLVAPEAHMRVLTLLHECTIVTANDTLDSLEGGVLRNVISPVAVVWRVLDGRESDP